MKIDIEAVAAELTDNDLLYRVLRVNKQYVKSMRESTAWSERYMYYLDILKKYELLE